MPIYWVFYFLMLLVVVAMGVILFSGGLKIIDGGVENKGLKMSEMKWLL